MRPSPRRFWSWIHTPSGIKWFRYSLVSVVAILVSQAVLFLTYGVLRLWSAVISNVVATAVATVPSYYLNRRWVWGKGGRSHLLKEIAPFWALAFLGLALSIWSVDVAERWAKGVTSSHPAVVVTVMAASLAAFGVVWVMKFLIFNHLLFVDHSKGSQSKGRRSNRAARPLGLGAVQGPSHAPAPTMTDEVAGHRLEAPLPPPPERTTGPAGGVGGADEGLAVATDTRR